MENGKDVNQSFGVSLAAMNEDALRAQAAAMVADEENAKPGFLLAKFVAEERAMRDAELQQQAADMVAADGPGSLNAQGFPNKYHRIVVFKGNAKDDLSYVPVSVNGYAFKIARGIEVIVPTVVTEALEHAIEDVTEKSEGGLVTRPSHRFPFTIKGDATEAEYQAFKTKSKAAGTHAAAA